MAYEYTFEDRIHKHKLPKGLSYVLQTKDITAVLPTDGLAITYRYSPNNPQKIKKSIVRDFYFTNVNLLSYSKLDQKLSELGGYDRHLVVYSVPARLRKAFRFALTTNILPRLKELESSFKVSVYYSVFHKNSYERLDWGGLYIEEDRYGDKEKVLYRDKEFDVDKEIKEIVS